EREPSAAIDDASAALAGLRPDGPQEAPVLLELDEVLFFTPCLLAVERPAGEAPVVEPERETGIAQDVDALPVGLQDPSEFVLARHSDPQGSTVGAALGHLTFAGPELAADAVSDVPAPEVPFHGVEQA